MIEIHKSKQNVRYMYIIYTSMSSWSVLGNSQSEKSCHISRQSSSQRPPRLWPFSSFVQVRCRLRITVLAWRHWHHTSAKVQRTSAGGLPRTLAAAVSASATVCLVDADALSDDTSVSSDETWSLNHYNATFINGPQFLYVMVFTNLSQEFCGLFRVTLLGFIVDIGYPKSCNISISPRVRSASSIRPTSKNKMIFTTRSCRADLMRTSMISNK